MSARRSQRKKIDTIEKLAQLVVESMEDVRSDMGVRFDRIDDQIAALQDRVTAVESKIAGLHWRIDQELDTRPQADMWSRAIVQSGGCRTASRSA